MGAAFHAQLLDMIQYSDFMATFADPARVLVDIEPFSYVIDGNALSANIGQAAPQVFQTPMMGDCDFVMQSISAFGRVNTQTVLTINPALLVQISDLSTGRTFFSAPTPVPFVAGQGGFPFLLPGCKIIKARATLQTTITSAQNQAFSGVFMAFHGARLWYG